MLRGYKDLCSSCLTTKLHVMGSQDGAWPHQHITSTVVLSVAMHLITWSFQSNGLPAPYLVYGDFFVSSDYMTSPP